MKALIMKPLKNNLNKINVFCFIYFAQTEIDLYLHPLSRQACFLHKANDSVAQLVEHYTFNVVVLGSNPS